MTQLIQLIFNMEKELQKISSDFCDDQVLTSKRAIQRATGKDFQIQDYIEGMIRSMLTAMVDWYRIKPHFDNGEIPDIFSNYDPQILKKADPIFLETEIRKIKCGNICISKQMKALGHNVEVLQNIESKYGTIDQYFRCLLKNYPSVSYSELQTFIKDYRLAEMGVALICEFLKNMGFDLPKPDRHLRRFFGKERIGYSKQKNASEKEVFDIVENLAQSTGKTRQEIDLIIWAYCAEGYGQICTAKPKCNNCVCNTYCHLPH